MPNRSAKTGRKVSKDFADKNPETTIREGKSKDTKRLDWMTKNLVDCWARGDGPGWKLEVIRDGVRSAYTDKSPRAVIDKAMKAEKVQ